MSSDWGPPRNPWGTKLRPFQYAWIIARRPREQRAMLLERVPEHIRDIVRAMVVHELSALTNWKIRLRANPIMRAPRCILRLFDAYGLDDRGNRPPDAGVYASTQDRAQARAEE